jgi:hypothetical protein
MKHNLFVFLVACGFAYLTHAFCGGISLSFWQQVVGFSVCLVFWLLFFAPAFILKDNKL